MGVAVWGLSGARPVKAVQVAVAAGGGIGLLEAATAGSTSLGVHAAASIWPWAAAFAALQWQRLLSTAAPGTLHSPTLGCRRCVLVHFCGQGAKRRQRTSMARCCVVSSGGSVSHCGGITPYNILPRFLLCLFRLSRLSAPRRRPTAQFPLSPTPVFPQAQNLRRPNRRSISAVTPDHPDGGCMRGRLIRRRRWSSAGCDLRGDVRVAGSRQLWFVFGNGRLVSCQLAVT